MARLLLCFKPQTTGEDPAVVGSRVPTSRVPETHSSESATSHEPRRTVAFVELLKHRNEPLGLVLKGGADCDQPVYVGQLHPGGVAEKSGALQIGDYIRGINGTATDHLNQNEANSLLINSGNVINLEIEFEAPPDEVDSGTMKKTALIQLKRERNSFGFTISGGRTENRPITISNVTVGSMAYKNGTLKAGDRILKVNWNDVTRASQMETLSHLKSSDDTCSLEIEYDVTVHEGLGEYRGQLLVELLKPKGASLGISLQESPTPGGPLIISKIKEAGIADRCGALHVGDRLLFLNKESLKDKTITDVHRLLKHCDLSVELEIVPGHNFPRTESISSHLSSSHHSPVAMTSNSHLSSTHLPHDSQSIMSYSSLATTAVVSTHPEVMTIRLEADVIGYGLSLQGGATEWGVFPLLIASIEEGGPAARLGQLQPGDKILSIDGIKMDGYSLQEALKLVQEADNVIEMEVMFDVTDTLPPSGGTFDVHMKKTASLNLGITINSSRTRGDPIWISNLKKGGIAYRSGMLRSGDVIKSINGQSLENCNLREAAQMLRSVGESVKLTIAKESSPPPSSPSSETIIYSVELHRNQQSLGITLTGSRDQAGHPVVISKIKEGGVAYKTGTLKVGDRILAINGESLYNKTMPEAVHMLNLAGDIVNLKISKASRKHKSRHKSGSPTGKAMRGHYREYGGHPIHHSASFASSSSSSYYGMGTRNLPRSLNYRIARNSFEPVLGESASGYNTPDDASFVSSVPPLYPGQLRMSGGGGGFADRLTPTSEVSGIGGGGGGGGGLFLKRSGSSVSSSSLGGVSQHQRAWHPHHQHQYHHHPHMLSPTSPLDDDQMSSVSTSRNARPFFLPYSYSPDSQRNFYQLRHQTSGGGSSGNIIIPGGVVNNDRRVGGASKRDSSTDDELSLYEMENRIPKQRRASLPEKSLYPSPHYFSRPGTNSETAAGAGGNSTWDFKHAHKQHIPIGRVSPLTPTETDRLASYHHHHQHLQQPQPVKVLDNGQFKPGEQGSMPPSPPAAAAAAAPPDVAMPTSDKDPSGSSPPPLTPNNNAPPPPPTSPSQKSDRNGKTGGGEEEEDEVGSNGGSQSSRQVPLENGLQVVLKENTNSMAGSPVSDAAERGVVISPPATPPEEELRLSGGSVQSTSGNVPPPLSPVRPHPPQVSHDAGEEKDVGVGQEGEGQSLGKSLVLQDESVVLSEGAKFNASTTPSLLYQPNSHHHHLIKTAITSSSVSSNTSYPTSSHPHHHHQHHLLPSSSPSLPYQSNSIKKQHTTSSPSSSSSSSTSSHRHTGKLGVPPNNSFVNSSSSPRKQQQQLQLQQAQQKTIGSNSTRGGSSNSVAVVQHIVPSLSEFKQTLDNATKFEQAITALAESGSSDQDSDSEPHSKQMTALLPPSSQEESAKVIEKMRASQSTVVHTILVKKMPGEVSFGFSIADGRFDQGVYVKTVKPGGPSERAGLQQFDKIVKVNEVTLLSEHKSENVYPLLKRHENEVLLMVKRSSAAPGL